MVNEVSLRVGLALIWFVTKEGLPSNRYKPVISQKTLKTRGLVHTRTIPAILNGHPVSTNWLYVCGIPSISLLTVIIGGTDDMFFDVFVLPGVLSMAHPGGYGESGWNVMIQHVVRY